MNICLQRRGSLEDSRVTDCFEIGGKRFVMTFDTNKPTQRYIHELAQAGICYEVESTMAIEQALQPGDVFFDVGANCGWFSALALACGAKVFAFEMDAENCAALRANAPGATVIEAAVANRAGTVETFVNLDNDGGHSLWPCGRHPHNTATVAAGNPKRIVPCVTLDDFAAHRPAVIKCDTEGAEWLVLDGARQVLADPLLRLVILENHGMGLAMFGKKAEDVLGIMAAHGFTIETPNGAAGLVSNWICRRP